MSTLRTLVLLAINYLPIFLWMALFRQGPLSVLMLFPVVLICGFSQDWYEFYTPYRVANRLVCNGCFNDLRVIFTHVTCPYHKGTSRELECQKKIYPRQVINTVERLIVDKNLTPPILK